MTTLTPIQAQNKRRAQAGFASWRQNSMAAAIAASGLPMLPHNLPPTEAAAVAKQAALLRRQLSPTV